MMNSGYRLALLGKGQIVNAFDWNRLVLVLVLVGIILLPVALVGYTPLRNNRE